MTDDPRLAAFLALAQERAHPYYAAGALRLAREAGDEEAMSLSLSLGALNWRPEPVIRMRGEKRAKAVRGQKVIQSRLWEEAA